MFDRLKKLFRRAEEEVAKKVEEKIEAAPAVEEPIIEEVPIAKAPAKEAPKKAPEPKRREPEEETLSKEVLEAMREVEEEERGKRVKEKVPEKPRAVERPREVEKPREAEKPKAVERPKPPEKPKEIPKKVKEPAEEIKEPEAGEPEAAPAESYSKEFRKDGAEGSDKRVEKKVRLGFGAKLKSALGVKARLSESEIEETAWNLQMGLMESDVAMEVAEAISTKLKEKLSTTEFKDPKSQVREAFKETLVEILESGGKLDFMEFVRKHKKPVRVVFFGINGTGKTTTIAKVVHLLKKSGFTVVVAAADTFRAGAQEQLGVHAERLGVKMVHHQRGGDAAAVVFDAVKHAEANGIDIVLADTSGRMQSDMDLMGEMEKIVRVNKPDLKVFIGDALTGNDAVEQAREFNEKIGIDASILAKFDASKGGAALSISYITKKPIIFLGHGQTYEDLRPFDAREFVDQII